MKGHKGVKQHKEEVGNVEDEEIGIEWKMRNEGDRKKRTGKE